VVVGFNPQPAGEGPVAVTVTAGDARAWPEIYLDPVGWIPMDVAGATAAGDPDPSPQPSLSATAPVSPLPTVPRQDPGADPDVDVGRADPRGAADRAGLPWLAGGLVASVPVLLGLIVLLRLRRDRQRLVAEDAAGRVRGAWAGLLDGARLGRIQIKPQWTVSEVVAAVSEAVAVAPATELAASVNRAGFATGPAMPGGTLDVAQAQAAIDEAADLVRRVRRRAGPLRRALWWLDPRPLWWRPARDPITVSRRTPRRRRP
jgi:hypothetical protein